MLPASLSLSLRGELFLPGKFPLGSEQCKSGHTSQVDCSCSIVEILIFFRYILGNNPLSDVSFANIFSQAVACLLILLILFFTEGSFSILMKSSLSVISLMNCFFDAVQRNTLSRPRSSRRSRLPSGGCIVLHSTFRCVIHFGLIFVKIVKSVSRFFFFFSF